MRKILISTIGVAILIAVGGCKSDSMKMGGSSSTTKPNMMASYTCPMHPEVISDKPGKCPKCAMDLIAKK